MIGCHRPIIIIFSVVVIQPYVVQNILVGTASASKCIDKLRTPVPDYNIHVASSSLEDLKTNFQLFFNVAYTTQFLCAILNSWERGPGE